MLKGGAPRGWRDPELVLLFAEICQKPYAEEIVGPIGSASMQ
jgi:hypothetical protein